MITCKIIFVKPASSDGFKNDVEQIKKGCPFLLVSVSGLEKGSAVMQHLMMFDNSMMNNVREKSVFNMIFARNMSVLFEHLND